MKKPVFLFEFIKGDEDWDYGLTTMDIMFAFFLIPEKAKNYDDGVRLWQECDLQNLALSFFNDKVSLNPIQSNLFLDATDAMSRMLLTGDDKVKDIILEMVQKKSSRFNNLTAFENYYLHHSSKLLKQIKDYCSKDDALFEFYKSLFQRGRDNFSYDEWRKGLNLVPRF